MAGAAFSTATSRRSGAASGGMHDMYFGGTAGRDVLSVATAALVYTFFFLRTVLFY